MRVRATRHPACVRVRCGAPPTPRRQLPRTGDGRDLARGVVSRARGGVAATGSDDGGSGEGEYARPTVDFGVVVEGPNDAKAVLAAVRAAEVHSLNGNGALQPGFRLAEAAHAELAQLKARHARLVVLTDPDVTGRHLRETLERHVGPLLYVALPYSTQGDGEYMYVCWRTHSQHSQHSPPPTRERRSVPVFLYAQALDSPTKRAVVEFVCFDGRAWECGIVAGRVWTVDGSSEVRVGTETLN